MPVETEYYETLEITHTANEQDVRRAYKRLALKYHPDRNHGNADAANQFKRIGEAYEVLNDPEKRTLYDAHGKAGLRGQGDMDEGFAFHRAEDIFSMFFGGDENFTRKSKRERKPSEIVHEIRVTLEDLYNGTEKTIFVQCNRLCSSCEGIGIKNAKNLPACRACDGSGTVRFVERTRYSSVEYQSPCQKCEGQGKIIRDEDICRSCRGKGIVRKKQQLDVSIERGLHEDDHVRLVGEGHQSPDCRLTGDLVLVFALQPHDVFTRKGDILVTSKKISLFDALQGKPVSIVHLDKRKLRLVPTPQEQSVIDPNFIWCVAGEGMPIQSTGGIEHGDLFVRFTVEIPRQLLSPSVFTENAVLKKELDNDWRYVRNVSSAKERKLFHRTDATLTKVSATKANDQS